MPKYTFPQSVRKYIRSEKARIRRGALDLQKQTELIDGIYKKILGIHQKKQQKSVDKQDNIISAAVEKVLLAKR